GSRIGALSMIPDSWLSSIRMEGRDGVLDAMTALCGLYQEMPKDGLLPEQHANAIIKLTQLRDLLALEISDHTIELHKSQACVDDWGSVSTVDWLRHNGKMTSTAAADCLHVGEQLGNLPRTLDAVRDGRIGFAHAAIIARHAQAIAHSDSAEPFDERPFLKVAERTSPSKLWYHAMHEWHRADPEGVADEQRQEAEARYLRFSDAPDGSVSVRGRFDSAAGATIRTALEPLARPQGEADDRCTERRYADAWVDLAEHALDAATIPQHGSVRPHVQVTTTLETLRGLIGAPAGEMALSLPISAKTVQRIACDSSITRVLLGADSAVIDAGRAKRVVSGGTRRLLEARDKFCRWPGCERPASWTAAHHIIHWAQGGKTDLSNLVLLCRHHHWMVHEAGWRLSLSPDGRVLAVPPETDFYPWQVHQAEFEDAARAPDEFDAA
ncbi:MAG TPA: DUF222 domain-containing protein, partial [Candidatus Dormibacteraeota bacterium]|nr:DUF222 domain-containing protein [Candidatus Dormibacteraeota bacterium]